MLTIFAAHLKYRFKLGLARLRCKVTRSESGGHGFGFRREASLRGDCFPCAPEFSTGLNEVHFERSKIFHPKGLLDLTFISSAEMYCTSHRYS